MNRWSIFSALFFVLLLSACAVRTGDPGGGGGSGEGGGGGGGQNDGWGSRTDIEAIFQNDCSSCHGSAWSSCWDVHGSASTLQDAIASGAMPRGQTMAPSDRTAVLAWLQAGAACVGPEPDGGAPSVWTSAAPP
jgi:hypothetical protein